MRKAPVARPCGAGVPMDELPPKIEQNTAGKAGVASTGVAAGIEAERTGLTDADRRPFPPRHS